MLNCIYGAAIVCKAKIHGAFQRVFKEQAGGAEIIATLVIIAVVLVLALAFREKLVELVADLWNSLVKGGAESGEHKNPTISEW